ncbi:MAG: 4-(cytidine 5'-diphospho)-2-C-methyl-D-erythritol kinase [Ktedonobacteraceae bacterium]
MNHVQSAQLSSTVCFVRAYAKINLTLDVLGRRTDGYHELATIMQTVDLYDTICLTASTDQQVHFVCSTATLSNEENLAARAARLAQQFLSSPQGVRIELYKRIPTAAGLGGGSSDAAAILLALQQWWQLHLSPSDLLTMAASLGSDVPFFLTSGLALCEGRGERVTPLAQHNWPVQMHWLLLLKPAISVSTAAVFRHLPTSDYSDGRHTQAVCAALNASTNPPQEHLHNSLERGVLAQYPAVASAKAALLDAGTPLVRLSGSGPTLFAPFADLISAVQIQQHMRDLGYEVYLTRAIYPTTLLSTSLPGTTLI